MELKFKKWLEATTMKSKIGDPVDIEPPVDDDGGDDEDEWDFENLVNKYGAAAKQWAVSSPAAKQIQFEAISSASSIRPAANAMIWPLQSVPNDRRHLIKTRQGQAMVYATWRVEMFGTAWEAMVNACKPIMQQSDMYKIFGEQGREGSAALVFKGDVPDFLIYVCLIYLRKPDYSSFTKRGLATDSGDKIVAILEKAAGRDRVETYLKRKIAAYIRWPHYQDIKLTTNDFGEGATGVRGRFFEIKFHRRYTFAI